MGITTVKLVSLKLLIKDPNLKRSNQFALSCQILLIYQKDRVTLQKST